MKPKFVAIAAALLLVASACDRLPFVGDGDERTVLVDFSHDEFASFFLLNFPKKVAVTPGTKVVFRQTWTGEPHTVTGGISVNEAIGNPLLKFVTAFDNLAAAGVPIPDPEGDIPEGTTLGDAIDIVEESEDSDDRTDFLEAYEALIDEGDFPDRDEADEIGFGEFAEDITPGIEEAFTSVLFAFNEETDDIAQNVGQPCYLTRGMPPTDPDEACEQQEKPEFDGTQSFFNSGIIPYEGPQGNTYEMQLADDIDPGTYFFYCAIHGPGQSTELEVRPAGADVPSQEEISREARAEIDQGAEPLEEVYRAALDDGRIRLGGPDGPTTFRGPFAGLYSEDYDHAVINEFVPKQLEVDANEPITWKMLGAEHTITFGVPRYFPIVQFLDDGRIRFNPRLRSPAGGAEDLPEIEEGPPAPIEHDAGTYDGTGFWSTGLIGSDVYVDLTLRISEPGTYDFACLIHPPMVGEIEVT